MHFLLEIPYLLKLGLSIDAGLMFGARFGEHREGQWTYRYLWCFGLHLYCGTYETPDPAALIPLPESLAAEVDRPHKGAAY